MMHSLQHLFLPMYIITIAAFTGLSFYRPPTPKHYRTAVFLWVGILHLVGWMTCVLSVMLWGRSV